MNRISIRVKKTVAFFSFLRSFNGPVIICKLPASKKEETGYFHRIQAIDGVFKGSPVVYANWNKVVAEKPYFDISQRRMQLNLANPLLLVPLLLCLLKSRKIYFHHVASIRPFFRLIARFPFMTTIVDFHGAAPEEHEMAGLQDKVEEMTRLEKFALGNFSYGIVVTEAMKNHLLEKYGKENVRLKFITLPIIQPVKPENTAKPLANGKYVIVYAGNMQKWQQIPLMLEAMAKNRESYDFRLYCTDPEAMNNLPENKTGITARSIPHEELLEIYRESHVGFALREDCAVNRVACPTKLVEYLAHGVIPIVLSPEIGDFKSLGMAYVTLEQFMRGDLPDLEAMKRMAAKNYEVYQNLPEQYNKGKKSLINIFSGKIEI